MMLPKAIFLALVLIIEPIYAEEATSEFVPSEKCTLYMAESSIPGAGQGVFTIRNISKGTILAENDISVAVVDAYHNNGGGEPPWVHYDYFWSGEWPSEFFLGREIDISSFPMGALSNFHTFLHNISPVDVEYDDTILSRVRDPGAGAFSYHGRKFAASRDIIAGEEIFANYGERWLDTHKMYNIPKNKHFRRVDRIVQELMKLEKSSLGRDHRNMFLNSIKEIISWYDGPTASALPKDSSELLKASESGSAWNSITNHTVEWIDQNGKCLDNIRRGRSTIEQAGHGAFATRFIPRGELVVPIPILHIMDKSTFIMYGSKLNRDYEHVRSDRVIGKQLLLNYCFGNNDSSLLLCPSSHGGLINHKRECPTAGVSECSNGPNADYRWSSDVKTREWLELSFEEMKEKPGRGLTLDIIATQDIHPGEEIFIDYGADWENAWNEHNIKWKPPTGSFETFSSTKIMNSQNPEIRTVEELESNPYPSNVMTACLYWEEFDVNYFEKRERNAHEISPVVDDYDDDDDVEDVYPEELSIEKQIKLFSIPGSHFTFEEANEGTELWPCKVYDHDEEAQTFTVRIYQTPNEDLTPWAEEGEPRFLTGYPRESIRFVNRPYKTDQFLPGAFRQPIGMRDDIFPNQWKNLLIDLFIDDD